ncbi:MAG: acyl-CoA/acyl-ACP dehydrogenase [Burkholderiaceae bacterium]|nr:acyl-CoA/acyl-ACP dehydrogenase [Burkholderiaceae bacterium]
MSHLSHTLQAAPPVGVSAAPGHAALIERARQLGAAFAELAAEHDATGQAPEAQFEALRAAGLLRLTIDRAHGGHGAGLAVACEVIRALAYGDPSVALILSMHYSLHSQIARSLQQGLGEWPEALAHQLIAESLEGRSLLNAAQVEPALGSPSYGGLPATVARRVGDIWVLSGHKRYVTGVPLLSWISVLAVTDEAEPRLGSFLVPRNAPGVEVIETWDPIGMRATASHDVVFHGVLLPLDHTVGLRPAPLGLRRDAQAIAWYFGQVSAVYHGAAQAARDWLLHFLNERKPSALDGACLASVPTVQDAVGRIEGLLATNDWLLHSHAQAHDAGTAPDHLGALVKQVVTDNAVQAVAQAFELAGNHGLVRRNPLERHHRNVLCSLIHAPPNALLRAQAGRRALQEAAGPS